jgi:hypothetical protein
MFVRLFLLAVALVVMPDCCQAGGHQRLVRASGITPRQVGTHEGVGMSTRSYTDARNNACFWGKRTPVSIQYSKQGNRYYAVVRYR